MRIKVLRKSLLASLRKLDSCVKSKIEYQPSQFVLLEAKENRLILTKTNLEIRIQTEIKAEVFENGKVAVSSEGFLEVVREFLEDKIEIDSYTGYITLTGGAIFNDTSFPTLDPGGFPVSPPFKISVCPAAIRQSELAKMIKSASYAVKKGDGTRVVLENVLFSVFENKLIVVTTDGRRLALMRKPLDVEQLREDIDVVLPVKAVKALGRVLKKTSHVNLCIFKERVVFKLDQGLTVITIETIDEEYPNYLPVVPVSFTESVDIPRKELLISLKNLYPIHKKSDYHVKMFLLQNGLKIELIDIYNKIGYCDYISVEYVGERRVFDFNPVYLTGMLKSVDSDIITMKMNDGGRAVCFTNEDDFLSVIMPFREENQLNQRI